MANQHPTIPFTWHKSNIPRIIFYIIRNIAIGLAYIILVVTFSEEFHLLVSRILEPIALGFPVINSIHIAASLLLFILLLTPCIFYLTSSRRWYLGSTHVDKMFVYSSAIIVIIAVNPFIPISSHKADEIIPLTGLILFALCMRFIVSLHIQLRSIVIHFFRSIPRFALSLFLNVYLAVAVTFLLYLLAHLFHYQTQSPFFVSDPAALPLIFLFLVGYSAYWMGDTFRIVDDSFFPNRSIPHIRAHYSTVLYYLLPRSHPSVNIKELRFYLTFLASGFSLFLFQTYWREYKPLLASIVALVGLIIAGDVEVNVSEYWARARQFISIFLRRRPYSPQFSAATHQRHGFKLRERILELVSTELIISSIIFVVVLVLALQLASRIGEDLILFVVMFIVNSAVAVILLAPFTLVLIARRGRQKYIVIPFTFLEKKGGEEQNIAKLITHTFVEQIRQIGMLLTFKQVEIAETASELSFIVSSGYDKEFATDLRSLANLSNDDRSENPRWFSEFIAFLTRALAIVRVTGTIQRRSNGSLQIWVELSRRGNQEAIAVEVNESNFGDSNLIDDATLQRLTKSLAVKLVLKMGQGVRFASNEESLESFLTGLQASAEKNWWRAIDAYRTAVHIEEALHGDYAPGHYHLGTGLISAGEIDEGIRYLDRAEQSETPMAEARYMRALIELQVYWDTLHSQDEIIRNSFDRIVDRCTRALKLRPNFPEVYHLLGAAYYQRARLKQRDATRKYIHSEVETWLNSYREDYRRARRHFRKALHGFDQELMNLSSQTGMWGDLKPEYDRLYRERTTVIHRLADCLRSLELTLEADSYYRDTLHAWQSNLRTLIDSAKNLCLYKTWTKADEYIETRIRHIDEARWHADMHIYKGWALAGRSLTQSPREKLNTLADAMHHIDYAIYRRPQYITRWHQNDWMQEFQQSLASFQLKKGFCKTYDDLDSKDENIRASQLRWWLGWRMYMSGYDDNQDPFLQSIWGNSGDIEPQYPVPSFMKNFKELREQRTHLVRLLDSFAQTERLHGLINGISKLDLASIALDNWKDTRRNYKAFIEEHRNVAARTFSDRWVVNLIAETALFASRILVEARQNQIAYEVASATAEVLETWRKQRWELSSKPGFNFSHNVFRIQTSLLHSWAAYSALHYKNKIDNRGYFLKMNPDFKTAISSQRRSLANQAIEPKSQLDLGQPQPTSETLETHALQKAQRHVQAALENAPRLGLAMLSDASLLLERGQPENTIEKLYLLLEVIEPVDPGTQIASWKFNRPTLSNSRKKKHEEIEPRTQAAALLRKKLSSQERISGQLQTAHYVNAAETNILLASAFYRKQLPQMSVQHLLNASTSLAYRDLDADILIKLLQQLDALDRFKDAKSIIQALRLQRNILEPRTFSFMKQFEADVWGCVIDTRLGNFSESLAKGRILERELHQKLEDLEQDPSAALRHFYRASLHPTSDGKKAQTPEKVTEIAPEKILAESLERCIKHLDLKLKDIKKDDPTPGPSDFTRAFHLAKAWFDANTFVDLLRDIGKVTTRTKNWFTDAPDHQRQLIQELPLLNSAYVIEIWLIELICRDIIRLFEQVAIIQNNVVYNSVELGLLDMGKPPSEVKGITLSKIISPSQKIMDSAITLITKLQTMVEDKENKSTENVVNVKSDGEALENHELSIPIDFRLKKDFEDRYRVHRAYFLDTKGWLNYRAATEVSNYPGLIRSTENTEQVWELLNKAVETLQEALNYNQSAAIIYYHLSRAHLTLLEYAWQRLSDGKSSNRLKANEISSTLILAFRYWQKAQQLDQPNLRLNSRLTWLGSKLDEYRQTWHSRHIRGFAGDPILMLPK